MPICIVMLNLAEGKKKKPYLAVKLSWCHQIWDQYLLLAGMEQIGELYMLFGLLSVI